MLKVKMFENYTELSRLLSAPSPMRQKQTNKKKHYTFKRNTLIILQSQYIKNE